tara:strand:+ start:672 stop:902 length:231 start_codon:yes stop_codon:yes gene_type:complete
MPAKSASVGCPLILGIDNPSSAAGLAKLVKELKKTQTNQCWNTKRFINFTAKETEGNGMYFVKEYNPRFQIVAGRQ